MVEITNSFVSDEQLAEIKMEVTGPESKTLTESDYVREGTGMGPFTYEASFFPSAWGEYVFSLQTAKDAEGNDGAEPNLQKDIINIPPSYGNKLYMIPEGTPEASEYHIMTAFDLSTMELDDSIDFSSENGDMHGMAWDNEGVRLFLVGGNSSGEIYTYTVDEAYDISTASLSDTHPTGAGVNIDQPRDVTWTPNGGKLFIMGGDNTQTLYSFNASTSFDVGSTSLDKSYDVSGDDSSPRSLTWNTDGTKFYFSGATNVSVFEYTTDQAFNIHIDNLTKTATLDSSTNTTEIGSITWGGSGTSLFIFDRGAGDVDIYDCSTAFDLSTASYNKTVTLDMNSPEVAHWNGTPYY